MKSRSISLAQSPHFWVIIGLFTVISISHYDELLQNVPIIRHMSINVLFSFGRHTVERFLYTLIIAYSTRIFGVKGGGTVLVASALVMLPRPIFISPSPIDAAFETLTAIFVGILLVSLIEAWRRLRKEQEKLTFALAKLRLSEESYRDLFQNAIDAIWVHDLNGNITAANTATEELTGYTTDELLGKNAKGFLSEDGLALAGMVKTKLLKGEPVEPRYQQRLFRSDGTEAIMEITTRLITKNGQPIAFQNIARDVTEERRMRDNMRFYLRKVLAAQEEERKRIARDLHDETAQSLLLLIHRLDAIASESRDKITQSIQEKLTQLRSLAAETLHGIRRYAQELRPAILDDLGLLAALEWLADGLITEKGIEVEVQDVLGQALPQEAQLVLFRIAQEALGNIRKHAEASKAVIRLESGVRKMRMTITDNGKGFEVPKQLSDLASTGKLGLTGMQERAYLLHGTLSIQSEPGKGTTVIVEIPLEE